MSNSTRMTNVTFWETMTGKFLYTCQDMIEFSNGVDIEKSYKRILGLKQKSTTMEDLQMV